MFILILIFLLLVFLFISRQLFVFLFFKERDKTIEKLTLSYEEEKERLEFIIKNWIESLYNNSIISILLPPNSDDILILCSYENKKQNQIIAVPKNILSEFLYSSTASNVLIKESPNKNIYLKCKINKNTFNISLKLPFFYDKENVSIINDVQTLKTLFY